MPGGEERCCKFSYNYFLRLERNGSTKIRNRFFELTVPEFVQMVEGTCLLVMLHLKHVIELEVFKASTVASGFSIVLRPCLVFFSEDVVQVDIGGWLRKRGFGAIFPWDGSARRSRRDVGIYIVGTEDTQHG